jgi:hypothetical protein
VSLAYQKNAYQGRVFGVSAISGVMAAGLAANSEIIQFRFVDAAELRKLRILSVLFSAAVDGTAFTAGAATFDLVPARGFTAAGTGGGTATLTGNNGKFRTAQNQNLLGVSGEIRVATTAALTAGTKTLDAQGIASLAGGASAAGTQIIVPTDLLQEASQADGEPLILSHNEGFVVRATVPATGTWKFAAGILWAELSQ